MTDQANDEKLAFTLAADYRATLNGEWPKGTWFQRRLEQINAAKSQLMMELLTQELARISTRKQQETKT